MVRIMETLVPESEPSHEGACLGSCQVRRINGVGACVLGLGWVMAKQHKIKTTKSQTGIDVETQSSKVFREVLQLSLGVDTAVLTFDADFLHVHDRFRMGAVSKQKLKVDPES